MPLPMKLAHQWFGMQVEAANVQGRLMLLETLSQYAASDGFKAKVFRRKSTDNF